MGRSRRLLLALTVPVVVVATAAGAQRAAPCDGAQMSVVRDLVAPRGTGVSQVLLQLRNRGTAACVLARRPRLTLVDRAGAIPFAVDYVRRCRMSCGGTHPLTTAAPAIVQPGRSVYVSFDSYRCDLGTRRLALAVVITVGRHELRVALPGSRPAVAWCGPGDPGSVLHLSPYEPTPGLAGQRA